MCVSPTLAVVSEALLQDAEAKFLDRLWRIFEDLVLVARRIDVGIARSIISRHLHCHRVWQQLENIREAIARMMVLDVGTWRSSSDCYCVMVDCSSDSDVLGSEDQSILG
jgi:hypothetical protein